MGPSAKAGLVFAMVALALAGQLIEREFAGRRRALAQEKKTAPQPYEHLTRPLPDVSLPGPRGGVAGEGAEAAPEAARRTYVIQAGDTLSKVAKKVYGSEGAWKAILDANRSTIPDPTRLQVGTTLKMPPPEKALRP